MQSALTNLAQVLLEHIKMRNLSIFIILIALLSLLMNLKCFRILQIILEVASMPDSFSKSFEQLTGNKPFPWQAIGTPKERVCVQACSFVILKTNTRS